MGIPLTSMKLRVTDYSRVSTDHIEQQKSLKNQIEHFDEMIKNNSNWTYVKGYIDDGISGTTDYKRDNFMKMIEDAREGKFDLIVTKEISRFSRNTLDSIKYTRELLSYGVAVLFVNDNINTALPDSELRLTIMASMAQDEIRRLSERVKFGMSRSIKNGTILGNDMLYGYKKDKLTGHLIIVYKESIIVKRLFSLYAIENYSITKIAKIFNNENIETKEKKKWCATTLIRMIKNPKYKGFYCAKKSEIIDYMTKKVKLIPEEYWVTYEDKLRIPPIIEEELWQRANDKLKTRSRKLQQNKYPLSAKIYCYFDNEVFHRRKQCKSCDDITWVCSKYLLDGKKACDSPNIRESEIFSIIDDTINLLKIDLSKIEDILLELYNNKVYDDDYLIRLKKQKDKLILKKDKLLELNIEGIITNSEFNTKNNECNKELSFIDETIVSLNKPKNKFDYKKIIKQKINDQIVKNKLIDLLIKKIIVSKNNKENIELKIFLNFSKYHFEKEYYQLINQKEYEFKRGYNTTGTRRYIMKYNVSLFFSE